SAAAFLSINPIRPGHTLVVPVEEIDHWLDLDPATLAHLMAVAREIGRAQERAFRPERVGLVIAGFEVPHVHLHVIPAWGMKDLLLTSSLPMASRDELDAAAEPLRAALRELGHEAEVAAATGA